jgi:uncharacterized membrane protein YdbT with pleckstrin-like domain
MAEPVQIRRRQGWLVVTVRLAVMVASSAMEATARRAEKVVTGRLAGSAARAVVAAASPATAVTVAPVAPVGLVRLAAPAVVMLVLSVMAVLAALAVWVISERQRPMRSPRLIQSWRGRPGGSDPLPKSAA